MWRNIAELHDKAGSHSLTQAMNDVFKAREQSLNECLACIRCLPGQQGLLVVIDGEVSGFDMISRPEAYARLHEKLVRSCALGALLRPTKAESDPLQEAIQARS